MTLEISIVALAVIVPVALYVQYLRWRIRLTLEKKALEKDPQYFGGGGLVISGGDATPIDRRDRGVDRQQLEEAERQRLWRQSFRRLPGPTTTWQVDYRPVDLDPAKVNKMAVPLKPPPEPSSSGKTVYDRILDNDWEE